MASCATTPRGSPVPAPVAAKSTAVIEEAIRDIAIASPDSLKRAESSLSQSTAGYSDRGLSLSYVAYKMIQILYPLYLKQEYAILPPVASIYPPIFHSIESGRWAPVAQSEASFITLILPPLAVLYTRDKGVAEQAQEALDHAAALNPASVLPAYLKGYLAERSGNEAEALADYDRALSIAPSCYPAAVGKARILVREKEFTRAEAILAPLYLALASDAEIAQLYAQSLLAEGKVAAAGSAVDRALRAAPKSFETLVLAAQISDAAGDYGQALERIAAAEKLGAPDPALILLKAKLLREQGSPLQALDVLQAGVKLFPNDQELGDQYGKALIEAGRTTEGSRYIVQTLKDNPDSVDSLELLIDDAVKNKEWPKASRYLAKLLPLSSSDLALGQAYLVSANFGDPKGALTYAQRLYARHPSEAEFLLPYIQALVNAGQRGQALAAVDGGLKTLAAPSARSDLYYLRSTLEGDPRARLADLQSSLLENLGNVYSLVAIARLYRQMGDVDSASRYLRQAAAIAPDDPQVKAALAGG